MFDLKVNKFQEWLFKVDIQNSFFVQIYNNNRWGFISSSNFHIYDTTPKIFSEREAFQEYMQQIQLYPTRVVKIGRYLANDKIVITKVIRSNIK
jgi:hypothetical protein